MHFPKIFSHIGNNCSRTHMQRQQSSDSSSSLSSISSLSGVLSEFKLSDSTSSLDSATHYCVKLSANTSTPQYKTSYEGEVDSCNQLSGHGIMRNAHFVYAGQWSQSKPHGYGVLYNIKARTLYEGEFLEGRANGYGRLVVYSTMGDSSNDCYMYGHFQQGRFSRRRQSLARSDREKSIKHVGIARRAAALAAGQSSKTMLKALRDAHLATTTSTYAPVCLSDLNGNPPIIAFGSLTSFLAAQITAHH